MLASGPKHGWGILRKRMPHIQGRLMCTAEQTREGQCSQSLLVAAVMFVVGRQEPLSKRDAIEVRARKF
jgi:hypothetical protein